MLVLSRKQNESIRIGNGVTITVVQVRGNRVHLAIDAPREVAVHRDEVYQRIRRENEVAAVVAPTVEMPALEFSI